MDPFVAEAQDQSLPAIHDSVLRRGRRLWRLRDVLRYAGMATTSVAICLPMLLRGRPRTPLRVLCIGAFEYLSRLKGCRLDSAGRMALACACDFGALRNDFYDQRELDSRFYRELRMSLQCLAPRTETVHYIRELRRIERGRPSFGPGGFCEPGAVVEYRNRVLEVSLRWLQGISRQSLEPRQFDALVALVALVQLVDDLVDWKDDWASRRPTYVTAFLHDWARPSRGSMRHLRVYADRLRTLLISTADRRLEVAPLTLAGGFVWLVAVFLMRIRFPE